MFNRKSLVAPTLAQDNPYQLNQVEQGGPSPTKEKYNTIDASHSENNNEDFTQYTNGFSIGFNPSKFSTSSKYAFKDKHMERSRTNLVIQMNLSETKKQLDKQNEDLSIRKNNKTYWQQKSTGTALPYIDQKAYTNTSTNDLKLKTSPNSPFYNNTELNSKVEPRLSDGYQII